MVSLSSGTLGTVLYTHTPTPKGGINPFNTYINITDMRVIWLRYAVIRLLMAYVFVIYFIV